MIRFLIYAGFLLAGLGLNAQKDFAAENISIFNDSELLIVGRTNVNKFQCKFNIAIISDRKEIKYCREENQITFDDLNLHLLTEGFDCGNRGMNADFQDLLVSQTYPQIEIILNRMELFSEEYSKAFVTVKLAGKKNNYSLPVQIFPNRFKGSFKMNIRDFGLEPPKKALGLIEVDEEVEVQFDLKIHSHSSEN